MTRLIALLFVLGVPYYQLMGLTPPDKGKDSDRP